MAVLTAIRQPEPRICSAQLMRVRVSAKWVFGAERCRTDDLRDQEAMLRLHTRCCCPSEGRMQRTLP